MGIMLVLFPSQRMRAACFTSVVDPSWHMINGATAADLHAAAPSGMAPSSMMVVCSAGPASTTPTLCVNTALTPITHTTSGATGIGSPTGLPAGVTASWVADVITITGTPTADGTFSYSIPLDGGCGFVSAVGTITVVATGTVGAASSSPSLCINTPLTDITHSTSSVTGIDTPSGLPPGVTATWSNQTITISGTPTTAGTFNYTIPVIGCSGPTATGTITVIMLPNVIYAVTNASCVGFGNGAIDLSVDGSGPFSFLWSPGAQTTEDLGGIVDGSYAVTVTGAGGCSTDVPGMVVGSSGTLLGAFQDDDGDAYGDPLVNTTYCSAASELDSTNLIVDGSFEDQASLQNLPGYVPASAPNEVWGAGWNNWGWTSWQDITGSGAWTGGAIARTEEFAAGWKRAHTGNVFGIIKDNFSMSQTFTVASGGDGIGKLNWYDANRASWREHDWFGRDNTYDVTLTDDLGNVQQLGTYTSKVAGGTNYSTPPGGYGWWTTQGKDFWFARASNDFTLVAGRTYTLSFNSLTTNDDRTTFLDDITIISRAENTVPVGYVTNCSDCNDASVAVNPGATEVCNGIDDDCDGFIDDADPSVTGQATWYADVDGDGFGDAAADSVDCIQPIGYVANSTDGCPADALKQAPGACGCGVADVPTTYFADVDGDGFGDAASSQAGFTCIMPAGFVANSTDGCPADALKQAPGACGCGVADVAATYYADTDGDGFGAGPAIPGFTCIVLGVTNNTDLCPTDANKQAPGACGCGVADLPTTYFADVDGDGFGDPASGQAGFTCSVPAGFVSNSSDGCPLDPNKQAPGVCGCGIADVATTYFADADGDGFGDPASGQAGFTCSVPAGFVSNSSDGCPLDANKQAPGVCGCGVADVATTYFADVDGDGFGDPASGQAGFTCSVPAGFVTNSTDGCPLDPNKLAPGACGCGSPDIDNDNDGNADCNDLCPNDPDKSAPGQCGCGIPDTDTDGDGVADCNDGCITDPDKVVPGTCGCGAPDVPATYYADLDGDGAGDAALPLPGFICVVPAGYVANNTDLCPSDPNKQSPGACGCGALETDTDNDGVADCDDSCPLDALKTAPGICGCGAVDVDINLNGICDANENCAGDLNGDGVVNVIDFGLFNLAYGTLCSGCGEDLNGDGVVNVLDFGIFASVYGTSCP
jgi:hypothetical protein